VVGLKIDWGAWALARFCAPWVSDAGEKEKNGLPREREAFALRRFGPKSRGRVPAKAFFSFSPGGGAQGLAGWGSGGEEDQHTRFLPWRLPW